MDHGGLRLSAREIKVWYREDGAVTREFVSYVSSVHKNFRIEEEPNDGAKQSDQSKSRCGGRSMKLRGGGAV